MRSRGHGRERTSGISPGGRMPMTRARPSMTWCTPRDSNPSDRASGETRMTRRHIARALVATGLAWVALAASSAARPDDPAKDARLKSMRELAEAVILVEAGPGTRAQLLSEPIV